MVLVDSGATNNYVRPASVAEVPKDKFITKSGYSWVKLADGSAKRVKNEFVRLSVKFLDFSSREDFSLFDLDEKYDLILGMPWLRKHQPWIDWKDMTMGSSQPPIEPQVYANVETTPFAGMPSVEHDGHAKHPIGPSQFYSVASNEPSSRTDKVSHQEPLSGNRCGKEERVCKRVQPW